MPSMGEIKSRMKSIGETKKVTDAMYMISSVKMRRARREIQNTDSYFAALSRQIGELLRYIPDTENRYFHTALNGRLHARHGILLITSDKGLAGTYNQTAIKVAEEYMGRHPETVVFILGEYGRQYFMSKKLPYVEDFGYTAASPSVWEARRICSELLAYFDDGRLDEINVIFTDYNSALPSVCRRACLLPLDKSVFRQSELSALDPNDEDIPYREFIPDPETLLNEIVPSYLVGTVYTFLVESYCSEQQARMTAMNTAGKNADEMQKKLRTQYNKLRQAQITREMIEITSGAKALSQKKKLPTEESSNESN